MPIRTTALLQEIATNTGRIATAVEALVAGTAPKTEDIDIGEAVSKAMDAVAKSSPVFGAAMKQMEAAMLSSGVKK